MTIAELQSELYDRNVRLTIEQIESVWPVDADGNLVGPRPSRPPHKPPVKVPLDEA